VVAPAPSLELPSASAVVCAYTQDRWEMLVASVESLRAQTIAPVEIIVCIDHNDDLFERARRSEEIAAGNVPVSVVANRYAGHLGSARTTAVEMAIGDVVVFLDDDARAERDLFEYLLEPYRDAAVMAVGGAPTPDYSRPRPSWFPTEFDWVFGCVYTGLPTVTAPTTRLIGATMSARRDELLEIGGFHSDNHDDMDMCHRLAKRWPGRQIIFEPRAISQHFVHPNRLTWAYFWRRCFSVNRGKVEAHRNLPGAGDLDADRQFASNTVRRGLRREIGQVRSGDLSGLLRIACLFAGVGFAAAGYTTGTVQYWLRTSARDTR
jgi:glycosyltransferase involved in cell wall biosynthesis